MSNIVEWYGKQSDRLRLIFCNNFGSDVAIDSADAVIVHDNLDAVALAIYGILNAVCGALFHNCGSVLVVISAFLLLFYSRKQKSQFIRQ